MSLKDKNINVAPKEGVNEMLVQVGIVCLSSKERWKVTVWPFFRKIVLKSGLGCFIALITSYYWVMLSRQNTLQWTLGLMQFAGLMLLCSLTNNIPHSSSWLSWFHSWILWRWLFWVSERESCSARPVIGSFIIQPLGGGIFVVVFVLLSVAEFHSRAEYYFITAI